MIEKTYLTCDHCGEEAIEGDDKGLFLDGAGTKCMTCGFPGSVVCDESSDDDSTIGSASWLCSDADDAVCDREDCEECAPTRKRMEADPARRRAWLELLLLTDHIANDPCVLCIEKHWRRAIDLLMKARALQVPEEGDGDDIDFVMATELQAMPFEQTKTWGQDLAGFIPTITDFRRRLRERLVIGVGHTIGFTDEAEAAQPISANGDDPPELIATEPGDMGFFREHVVPISFSPERVVPLSPGAQEVVALYRTEVSIPLAEACSATSAESGDLSSAPVADSMHVTVTYPNPRPGVPPGFRRVELHDFDAAVCPHCDFHKEWHDAPEWAKPGAIFALDGKRYRIATGVGVGTSNRTHYPHFSAFVTVEEIGDERGKEKGYSWEGLPDAPGTTGADVTASLTKLFRMLRIETKELARAIRAIAPAGDPPEEPPR